MHSKVAPESTVDIIMAAHAHYRARVLQVDEELPSDLEWRDDVLYSSPKAYPSRLKVTYRVQIVSGVKGVHELAILTDRKQAARRLKALRKDIRRLTKAEFDEKYGIVEERSSQRIEPVSINKDLFGNAMLFVGIKRGSDS